MTEDQERGRVITELRERRLWTRERLAKEAGVSPATITQAEEGRVRVRLATIGKLAKALEVDPQEILHPKGVSLPLNMDAITQQVMEAQQPKTALELNEALDEACRQRLQAYYTTEELLALKDEILEELSRRSGPKTKEELTRESAEDRKRRNNLIENAHAVLRVLERTAGKQQLS